MRISKTEIYSFKQEPVSNTCVTKYKARLDKQGIPNKRTDTTTTISLSVYYDYSISDSEVEEEH